MIKAATLTELMGQRASADPDTPYFTLFDTPVPYGQLWRESERYAAGLRRFGIDRGDKVCLIYPTCAEFFYTFFGALRLGAIPVPLYPTLGVEGTANVFRDSEAKAVVTIGWFRQGVEESAAGRRQRAPRAGADQISRWTPRRRLSPPSEKTTSPSSSTPRAARAIPRGRGAEPRQRVPHRRVHGGGGAARAGGRRGVVAAALPRHGADRLRVHAAHDRRAAAPAAARPQEPARSGSSWSPACAPPSRCRPTSATATACATSHDTDRPRSLLAQAGALRRRAGAASARSRPSRRSSTSQNLITPCYGLAEATLAVAIWPRRTPLRLDASGKFLSVGQPCRGVSRPHHAGRPGGRGPGKRARSACASPGVMQGYYNNPEATAARALARRLAPHRRPRLRRRRGLSLRHRAAQGPDHPGRRERDPGRRGGDRGPRARRALLGGGRRSTASAPAASACTWWPRYASDGGTRDEHSAPGARDRAARAPRHAGIAPPGCSSSGPAPSRRPRAGKIQRSRLGEMIARRRAARRASSTPPARTPTEPDAMPLVTFGCHLPMFGPIAHARQRAHLRAAHGGARLRLALGQRSRGDPVPDRRRATRTTPPASSRCRRRAASSSRWPRSPWWRASPSACSSAPPSSCCRTGTRSWPPRCSPRWTTSPDGRVVLGVGVGWMREEIELLGGNYDRRGAWSRRGHPRSCARAGARRAPRYHGRVLLLRRDRRHAPARRAATSRSGSAATPRAPSAAWSSSATAGTPPSSPPDALRARHRPAPRGVRRAQSRRFDQLTITLRAGLSFRDAPARPGPQAAAGHARADRRRPPAPTATSASTSLLLEARYRDLDDMVAIYERFAREIRPQVDADPREILT